MKKRWDCTKEYVKSIWMYILVVLEIILRHIGKCGKMKTVSQQTFLKEKRYGVSEYYNLLMGGTMGKIIKDTIHAAGVDIGIYTQDFENEFISLTDIARYKSDDPTAVIQNWMRNR